MSSFLDRDKLPEIPNPLHDNVPLAKEYSSEGAILYAIQAGTDKLLGTLAVMVKGISRVLGESGRRHGSIKVQGPDIQLTGQYTTVGTAVTGSGTLFTTELAIGDQIKSNLLGEYREIGAIGTDTGATLVSAFSQNVVVAEDLYRQGTVAERIQALEDSNIAGKFDDGTPFWEKVVFFTMPANITSALYPHGISNAYDGKRIIDMRFSTPGDLGRRGGEGVASGDNIFGWQLPAADNDNFRAFRAAFQPETEYRAIVKYRVDQTI